MKLLRRLRNDEAGFVVSSELVLVATLLVIGLIVGLTSLRNQVVQELADTGAAIGMISQGYQYNGVEKSEVADTDGAGWDDRLDFCQTEDGVNVAGINLRVPPASGNATSGENGANSPGGGAGGDGDNGDGDNGDGDNGDGDNGDGDNGNGGGHGDGGHGDGGDGDKCDD